MEAAAGVAAGRGVSLPMPTSRKEWRVVSEHQSVQNAGDEDLECSKFGQSDERTIYEQGREPLDVDFCSITMDGSLDINILQQRLHGVVRQREELQQVEIELRARVIARSEILEMQNSYDAQIKEHTNANVKLQDRLRECEQTIHELERKMEEKERELHDIKLANEAAWAKEDLLREQNKELATFRRERDNSEAERAQHLKQIHDLQEHFQEKDRQFIELQEQNRVAQETLLFKDEQLREAQAWISRVQEVDALQSTTNHSLQAELRERTEQYHQLWLGCQRQFAEMERLHLHTLQQLQLELAEARERSGTYNDESHVSQSSSKDVSQFGQNNGSQLEMNVGSTSSGNSGVLPNGTAGNISSFVSASNASTQTDHVPGLPVAPSSILGMPTYLPPGQVTALHPFVMHQQGVSHSVPPHVSQSHASHFHSVPAISSLQHWQNQQGVPEASQMSTHDQYPPSQSEQKLLKSDSNYEYEMPVNGQSLRPDYLEVHISQGVGPDSVVTSSTEEAQVHESIDKSFLVAPQPQQSLQQISSQFHEALRLDSLEQNSETKEKNAIKMTNHGLEPTEQLSSASSTSLSDALNHPANFGETTISSAAAAVFPEAFVSIGQTNTVTVGKGPEAALLDEQALLACIVRTIPPGSGGRIRISSTLPNRLGKMLAPLHWHDYKRKYGKLDDFVTGHPELFVIEGDYIQLREGAQETIAATAAVAKVAAAAAVSSPYSSLLPSVAVTPMAQSHRLKKVPSIDSKYAKAEKTAPKEYAAATPANATDSVLRLSMQNQHSNGVCVKVAGNFSNIKILSKPKDALELNGSEVKPGQSSALMTVGNGANADKLVSGSPQNRGLSNGRHASNFSSKQPGRTTGPAGASRR
ncbi:uncharacterized protein LOC131146242 isoform X2 [Malania oleifera]|uniref:uncharacterized protein LOC131146242 isoform X2 n=1 Tax=Malania oleifera TaxID=397392 RepID=UPI0025AEA6D7|nr:uncharacterized protein LOC131146242 isoform X2 [Malania oleifera]XP_057951683.1 uncharacterized protein LOC131146242 isoform X2 [Malania oleifera]XP_057951684.1 uncharacterized protein LOC131146242 isoform X2 [Malania oleifera]